MLRSCSWFPKTETSSFARLRASIVGSSSNSVEIGGAAPMLSPDEIATVAAFAVRSAAQLLVRSAAPNEVHSISTSFMYDDYDLDYTYTNDYADLDEYYAQDIELDEDYARDSHDLEALAYRHYA